MNSDTSSLLACRPFLSSGGHRAACRFMLTRRRSDLNWAMDSCQRTEPSTGKHDPSSSAEPDLPPPKNIVEIRSCTMPARTEILASDGWQIRLSAAVRGTGCRVVSAACAYSHAAVACEPASTATSAGTSNVPDALSSQTRLFSSLLSSAAESLRKQAPVRDVELGQQEWTPQISLV